MDRRLTESDKQVLFGVFDCKENLNDLLIHNSNYIYFHHLSPIRRNVINWVPFKKGDEVLEIGSECGVLSEYLMNTGCLVDCYEKDLLMNEILYKRLSKSNNIDYIDDESKLLNIQKTYQYILLIGTFEKWNKYFSTSIKEVLEILKGKLSIDGKIIIATENKMGIRYLTGATYEIDGVNYKLNQNHQSNLFSKQELELLMKEIKGIDYRFYYPHPDYRFITEIYSDDYLPKLGDLYGSSPRYSPQTHQMEEDVLRNLLIEEGMIERFFNSYIIEVTFHE